MPKRALFKREHIVDLLNEQERLFLSPETKNKLLAYESYICDNLHGLYARKKEKNEYSIENGFYCLAGICYDEDLKALQTINKAKNVEIIEYKFKLR